MPIIDCDSHVLEPPDLWTSYLEDEYKADAIRIEQVDGLETLLIANKPILPGRLAGLGGAHVERSKLFAGGLTYMDGCPPASYDTQARLELYDEWKIDMGVIFPTIGILPFPTDDQPLATAYCRAYNRWLKVHYDEIPDHIIPIAILNWHDVDSAVEELKWCLKAGFKGVFVPPETVRDVRPGQVHFDPIWQLCEDAGIPGCLHVIVRFEGAAIPFRAWQETSPGSVFSFAMGAIGQLIPALASMVTDGTFERFPRLKIVSVEAGCGYAAYLMDRLDEKFKVFGIFAPTKLPMKPSEYIRRNCYFVAEPEERTIGAMLDLVGEDKILWGSDYPHIDSTLDAPYLIRESIRTLTEQRQKAVLGDNAIKLFNL